MIKLLYINVILFTLLTLTACTHLTTEKSYIYRANVKPQSVIAETEYDQYIFQKEQTAQSIQTFRLFLQTYQPYLAGGYIVIHQESEVFKNDVTATYYLIVNEKLLSEEQKQNLIKNYQVSPYPNHKKYSKAKNPQLQVAFTSTGIRKSLGYKYFKSRLTGQDTLAKPIPVTILTHGKQLNKMGEILIIPIFPLLMIYGCVTSNCI